MLYKLFIFDFIKKNYSKVTTLFEIGCFEPKSAGVFCNNPTICMVKVFEISST